MHKVHPAPTYGEEVANHLLRNRVRRQEMQRGNIKLKRLFTRERRVEQVFNLLAFVRELRIRAFHRVMAFTVEESLGSLQECKVGRPAVVLEIGLVLFFADIEHVQILTVVLAFRLMTIRRVYMWSSNNFARRLKYFLNVGRGGHTMQ